MPAVSSDVSWSEPSASRVFLTTRCCSSAYWRSSSSTHARCDASVCEDGGTGSLPLASAGCDARKITRPKAFASDRKRIPAIDVLLHRFAIDFDSNQRVSPE
ncbi:hypothetical protein C5688_20910 [Methylocystis sp. MitZ-2018]|nr:hypothetical protein C5688_20910 [Methylocystis sp. MitZ-2018]